MKDLIREIYLYLHGWERYEGKWIHPSGKNRYPLSTEEAVRSTQRKAER